MAEARMTAPIVKLLLAASTRQELTDLCRQRGLSGSGSKLKLASIIVESYSVDELLRKFLSPERLSWDTPVFLRALLDGCRTKSEILEHKLVKALLDAIASDSATPAFYRAGFPESFFRSNRKFVVNWDLVNLQRSKGKPAYEIRPEFRKYVESVTQELTLQRGLERFRSSETYRLLRQLQEHQRFGFGLPRNMIVGSASAQLVDEGASINRIVAFSDYRVQDTNLLVDFVKGLDPRSDLILYAGDDVDRFGKLPEKVLMSFLSRAKQTSIGHIEEQAPNVYTFRLRSPLPNRKSILAEIARIIACQSDISTKLEAALIQALKESKTGADLLAVAAQVLKDVGCRFDDASRVVRQREGESHTPGLLDIEIDADNFMGHVSLWNRLGEEPQSYSRSEWLSLASKLIGLNPADGSEVGEFLEHRSELVFETEPQSVGVSGVLYLPDQHENTFEVLASFSKHGLCAVIGNDDDPIVRTIIRGNKVFNVHQAPVVLGDHIIIGLEGACITPGEPNPGLVLYGEKDVSMHLSSFLIDRVSDKRVIIVSHTPPFETLDHALRFGERNIGSVELRRFVETNQNVKMVVSGARSLLRGQVRPIA